MWKLSEHGTGQKAGYVPLPVPMGAISILFGRTRIQWSGSTFVVTSKDRVPQIEGQ